MKAVSKSRKVKSMATVSSALEPTRFVLLRSNLLSKATKTQRDKVDAYQFTITSLINVYNSLAESHQFLTATDKPNIEASANLLLLQVDIIIDEMNSYIEGFQNAKSKK